MGCDYFYDIRLKTFKMKLFRIFLAGLCKIFRYTGVIYNVAWKVNFGDLIENTGKIIALNNLIKSSGMKANLRPMTKNDPILDSLKEGDKNARLLP